MKLHTIIWDFDGTILPITPYDSEQTLLRYILKESSERVSFLKRIIAKAAIYADMQEWLGASFKKYYIWILQRSRIESLDRVANKLATRISNADRKAFARLKGDGHHMMVLSCGTIDLIERTLRLAEIYGCFDGIYGNRFRFMNDHIVGMHLNLLNPKDKLKFVNDQGMSPEQTVVVGDGYTDLPLLDWAKFPVMIDRTGKKRKKYTNMDYFFISSIPELIDLINKL
jgi:phosphoserine phosphatase